MLIYWGLNHYPEKLANLGHAPESSSYCIKIKKVYKGVLIFFTLRNSDYFRQFDFEDGFLKHLTPPPPTQ